MIQKSILFAHGVFSQCLVCAVISLSTASISTDGVFGASSPAPEITCTGSGGEGLGDAGRSVSVAVSLFPGEASEAEYEWWLGILVDESPVSFTTSGWSEGLRPLLVSPLFPLPETTVFETTAFPTGEYTFYFGVDAAADGVPNGDSLVYDSASLSVAETGTTGAGATTTPVYLSFVCHLEEEIAWHENRAQYIDKRGQIVDLVELLGEYGASLNIQPDWPFVLAVTEYDDGPVTTDTNGKNLLAWIRDDMGGGVDPHAHGRLGYNMADVAYLIGEAGVTPSDIVGGLVVDPPEDSKYDLFTQPLAGETYPSYTWTAGWLWGDATKGHVDDEAASGVWLPKDAENFYVHDDAGVVPCIGKYQNDLEGLTDLLSRIESGDAPSGKIYTAAVFIGQGTVTETTETLRTTLPDLQDEVDSGRLVYAALGSVGRIWEERFDKEPNLYFMPSE